MMPRLRSVGGFTLIEAIIVIVITGILAGIVVAFITKPVEGYVDSVRRAELTDAADVALRRLARDVRLALPNSLRLKNSSNATVNSCASGVECYIEFIITKGGGRYRDTADGSTGGNFLSFTGSTPSFDVLGGLPTSPTIAQGDYIVVYNLGSDYPPADAYSGGNRVEVDATWGGSNPVTVSAATQGVFSSQSPPLPSPDARFQVVDKNDKVIRYGCASGALTRYRGCAFGTTTSGCTGSLLAGSTTLEPKAACVIEYQANATGRNGLLYLQLTLTDTPSGESVSLFQQIHVDNAP